MHRYKSLGDLYLDLDIQDGHVLLEHEAPIIRVKDGKNEGFVSANISKMVSSIIGVIDEPTITKVTYLLDNIFLIEANKRYSQSYGEYFWTFSDVPVVVSLDSRWSVYVKGLPKYNDTIKLLGYYSRDFVAQKLPQSGNIDGKIWKNNWFITKTSSGIHVEDKGVTILHFSKWYHVNDHIEFR